MQTVIAARQPMHISVEATAYLVCIQRNSLLQQRMQGLPRTPLEFHKTRINHHEGIYNRLTPCDGSGLNRVAFAPVSSAVAAARTAAVHTRSTTAHAGHNSAGVRQRQALEPSHVVDDALSTLSSRLKLLQRSFSDLNDEPSIDGVLNASQQLAATQRQLQAELRRCKLKLYRARRDARASRAATTSTHAAVLTSAPTGTDWSSSEEQQAVAELAAMKQLRVSADDGQDFLLGLVQQLLQQEPPTSCSRLLVALASRKLNVEALNRLAVDTFVEKQALATPHDMAGLMAALALVGCCSSNMQVAGFERLQLSSLFSGIMSHLVSHVSISLQQQQQQAAAPADDVMAGPGRLQLQSACELPAAESTAAAVMTGAGMCADTVKTVGAPGADMDTGIDSQAYLQQVAAALAAHVSAKVPIDSSLTPHILHLLQDQAPKWLHTVAEVETSRSVTQLAALVSHSGRYDFTYLAAALNRLAQLAQQQDSCMPPADCDVGTQQQQQQQRIAKVLVGRCKQLLAAASQGELQMVLTAAAKLGIHDSKFFAAASTRAVAPENLATASDGYLAAVMFAVATHCSSSSSDGSSSDGPSADSDSFSRQQQQDVMNKCLKRLIALARQQQQQASSTPAAGAAARSRRSRPHGSLAAADMPAAVAAAGAGGGVQPVSMITALWAAATCGLQDVKQLQATALLEYLAEPDVVQQLTGRRSWQHAVISKQTAKQQQQHASQLEQVARDCGTVVWAAAQMSFSGQLDKLKPYTLAFLSALDAGSLSCCSIVTVGVSLAMLLSRDKERQQQRRRYTAERPSLDYAFWESSFLQCSGAVVKHLMQQPPGPAYAASVAAQLMWGFDALGLRVPQTDMQALLDLSGDLAPRILLEQHWQHALSAAVTPTDVQQLLQTPAAAAALRDPSMAAAVMICLVDLQQRSQQQEDGLAPRPSDDHAASAKAVLRDCCARISQHLLPTLQALHSSAAEQQQAGTTAAAAVMSALPRLQCRESALASACLKVFAVGMTSASAADAAAVVSALSEAGRLIGVVYSADSSTLQEVVKTCTDSILKQLQSSTAQLPGSHAGSTAAAAGSSLQDEVHGDMHVADSMLQGYCPAVLAQKLLQLHVAVGLQPSAQQTFQLLSACSDESFLSNLRPNVAAATVAASLVAVAELSQLPDWQGISFTSGSNGAAASSVRPARRNTGNRRGSRASQFPTQQQQQQVLQFPWAWQGQQQQVVQELWQRVLLQALLPRLTTATPKQLSSALLAVAVLSGASGLQSGAAAGSRSGATDGCSLLEVGLAKDFTQAVLDAMLCLRPAAEPATDPSSSSALSQHDRVETIGGFLAAWRPGDWKGEHVAAVAVAAALLGVPCLPFFAGIEHDVVGNPQQLHSAAAPHAEHQPRSDMSNSTRQELGSHRHKPRVAKMHLQHVVSICFAAAALDCQVERLLSHAVASSLQQVQQQSCQPTRQATPAAAAADVQAEAKHSHKQRGKAGTSDLLGPELLLLLAAAVAVMDVSALAEQAQDLAACALRDLMHFGLEPTAAAGAPREPSETPATASARHVGALTARLVQVHAWLTSNSSSSRAPWSLADVLDPSELLAACAAWASLQQRSSSPILSSVSAALGHLLRFSTEVPHLHDVTEDGAVAADIRVTVHGVPVAVVLLDDAEEPFAAEVGEALATATAAAEQLAAGWAPAAALTPGPSTEQDSSCKREVYAEGAALLTGTCSQRLLVLAGRHGLGDAMWRAKALASRGYWVELISSREWMFLEGRWDAQVQYLRERLWPLLSKGGSVDVGSDDQLSAGAVFAVAE